MYKLRANVKFSNKLINTQDASWKAFIQLGSLKIGLSEGFYDV